jgi:pimeloyl-ACP methyl ester carboxylesterase
MVHGWMDVAASFQFVVDALEGTALAGRRIIAPDWRGFGLSHAPQVDSYWFPDYLGDLEAMLTLMGILGPIDLIGHSMGGNVVMTYAGARPERIRRLVNLEGFGLPYTPAQEAPKRMAEWLDSLKDESPFRDYASLAEVAARLIKTNPRLPADKAQWLAAHWSERNGQGRYTILGDPAHKRPNPVLYRVEEHLEFWKRISAPLLWVEADGSNPAQWWGTRYSKAQFHERLNAVPNAQRHILAECGHMLHHDQPEALAQLLAGFLGD